MKKVLKFSWVLVVIVTLIACEDGDEFFSFDEQSVSTGGSLARFHIDQTHLYAVESNSLSVFDITDFEDVTRETKLLIDRTVETIFRLDDVLYLGTTTGVLFYDITDPSEPKFLSVYEHLTGCDPVVSDGSYAYTTLRASGPCGRGIDVLDIVDIEDLNNPVLVNSYNMESPYGLILFDGLLFIGEGSNGMKVLDVSDVNNVSEAASYDSVKALDFIRDGDNLIITTEDGVTQVRVNSATNLSILSEINY